LKKKSKVISIVHELLVFNCIATTKKNKKSAKKLWKNKNLKKILKKVKIKN